MQTLDCQEKKCTKCHLIQSLGSFYASNGAYATACKECTKAKARDFRKINRDRLRIYDKQRRASEDPEARRAYHAAYRSDPARKAKAAAYNKEWSKSNPDKVASYSKSKYERYKKSPGFVLKRRIATALWRSMQGYQKETSWFAILGYTRDELVAHLERQFTKGMSWDNMGEWHIDHIVPLSSFSIETPDSPDFARAWALTNLRPMWGIANMSKGGKVLTLL